VSAIKQFILLLALLFALPVSAATFYVSTTGNDTNSGSLTSPWLTIQKAANTLAPGDTALVRGGIYPERVTVNVSGNAADGLVTFQNYPGETPILDGTTLTVPSVDNGLFLIQDKGFIAIQGFEIRNYRSSTKNIVPAGIFVSGTAHDITLRSNRVHHIETNYGSATGGDAFAIVVYGTSPTQAITNLYIQSNEVCSNKTGSSETVTVNGNVMNFDVSHNSVHDNNNIGIAFIGFEQVSSDTSTDRARNGTCRSNTVWNISSFGNPAYGNNYSADGIYCDGASNVVIELNRIYNCDIGSEIASEHANGNASHIELRDNLIWSNRIVGVYIGGYDNKRGWAEYCRITHNTLYHNDTLQNGNGEWCLQYDTRTNAFTHNIVVANSQNLLIGNQFSQNKSNLVDWNLYFAPGGTNGSNWQWKKTTYATFTAWQAGTGNDPHSLFADPKFVSEITTNFHLSVTSAALDAGDTNFITAPDEKDIDGQPRVSNGRTDIGADELNIFSPTLQIAPTFTNAMDLQLVGEPGHTFIWERSDTLTNWISFLTNSSDTGLLEITEAAATPQHYFRARMVQ
jgi:hypothetical protein